jgi:hypothetical protein
MNQLGLSPGGIKHLFIYSAFESTYQSPSHRILLLTSSMQARVNTLFPGLHFQDMQAYVNKARPSEKPIKARRPAGPFWNTGYASDEKI